MESRGPVIGFRMLSLRIEGQRIRFNGNKHFRVPDVYIRCLEKDDRGYGLVFML